MRHEATAVTKCFSLMPREMARIEPSQFLERYADCTNNKWIDLPDTYYGRVCAFFRLAFLDNVGKA